MSALIRPGSVSMDTSRSRVGPVSAIVTIHGAVKP